MSEVSEAKHDGVYVVQFKTWRNEELKKDIFMPDIDSPYLYKHEFDAILAVERRIRIELIRWFTDFVCNHHDSDKYTTKWETFEKKYMDYLTHPKGDDSHATLSLCLPIDICKKMLRDITATEYGGYEVSHLFDWQIMCQLVISNYVSSPETE